MVELGQVFPSLGAVAGFAAKRLAVRASPRHSLLKLPLVQINVATLAVQILPLIGNLGSRQRSIGEFVAIGARCRQVPAVQRKSNLFVAGEGKRRWNKTVQVMALFAAVQIRRAGELGIVIVLVAIRALREFDLVQRLPALGNMTFATLERCVLARERIGRLLMRLRVKQRWLPAVDGVAGSTFAAVGPIGELAGVRVFVAIGALGKFQGPLEIAVCMTEQAVDRLVHAEQRILRFGVIEIR